MPLLVDPLESSGHCGIALAELSVQFKTDPEYAVLKIRGRNSKGAKFRRFRHVGPDTGTGIIITDAYDAYLVGTAIWKATQVEPFVCLSHGDTGVCHFHIGTDYPVHLGLNLDQLLRGEGSGKVIVALGLLSFDVCAETTSAVEQLVHGTVKNMFCRVHSRINGFLQNYFLLV